MIVRERVEGKKTERGSKDNIKTPLPSSFFSSAGNQLGKTQKQPTIPKLLGSKSILAGVDTKSLTANSVYFISTKMLFSQDFPNSQGFSGVGDLCLSFLEVMGIGSA